MDDNKKLLVCIDGSYWLYFTAFGAVAEFQRSNASLASVWIKPAEECDQSNLPNLVNCEEFKVILKKMAMKRLETIEWIVKSNLQDQVDMASGIDFLFAMDDRVSYSFRKKLYPEYKAQRLLTPKSYNIYAIKKYITDVIFKELEVEKNYDYHMISVEGAEADDVIACICRNIAKDYMLTILYASDHDFIQLEGIKQYNLFGQKVECKVGDVEVTPKEYLLSKILLGDGADNISKVFSGVGPKKVLKLIKDKDLLKKKLSESQSAAKQFLTNKKLISFDFIPKELEQHIVEVASKKLYENEVINSGIGLKDFMSL